MKIEHPNRIEYRNDQGELHRLDGPAVEYSNGSKQWYINGKLHREDGLPAIEYGNGDKSWYINGKKHREDGPAREWNDGDRSYYLNDIYYSEKKYQTELIKLKLNRIKYL